MQQMGVGLAAAVLIDATLIRAVLLPAAMTLLGECELVAARRRWPALAAPDGGSVRRMSHAFRAAVEAPDLDAMAAALHPDVRFRSPGRLQALRGAGGGDGRSCATSSRSSRTSATRTSCDGGTARHGLVFDARRWATSRSRAGTTCAVDADGLVTELTVMIRPLSGLIAVAEAMGAAPRRRS